jgi:acyl carrier protein
MVPRTFALLPALPLTPNGKLDKSALATMQSSERGDDPGVVAPRDAVEQRLLAIWQRLLGRPTISVLDDFFELGGHSLIAVQLFAEIEKAFAVKLPLSTLFQSSTLAALAHTLRTQLGGQSGLYPRLPLVSIQPNGSRPPFFCVHGIDGDVHHLCDAAELPGIFEFRSGRSQHEDTSVGMLHRRMLHGAVHLAQADVTDGVSVGRVVTEVTARHGRLDVLVNAVGGFAGGDLLGTDARGTLDGLFRWLGIEPDAPIVERTVGQMPHVMVTDQPRARRWFERQAIIEPVLSRPDVMETAVRLGYKSDPSTWE